MQYNISESACAETRLSLKQPRMAANRNGSGAQKKDAFDLRKFMISCTDQVNKALDRFLPAPTTRPATIHKAMRYSLFAGGKRMRPALCLAAAAACGGRETDALPLACAVECIHTYSLIHDDLPAMDNDDFRRGVPTNHKVFGEAIAVLAGDVLLTEAFEFLAMSRDRGIAADKVLEVIRIAVTAAGYRGMIGGQVIDLECENRKVDLATVEYM